MDPVGSAVHILLCGGGAGEQTGGGVTRGVITFPMVCLGVCQLPVSDPSTGERVSNLEELPLSEFRDYIKVQTDKGTEVATNLVILCNGIKINSSAYHSAFGECVAQA